MCKRFSIFIIIALIIMFTGCNSNNYSITTCKRDPMITFANKSEVMVTYTVFVYHKDGFVEKTEAVQEDVLKNGDIKDLILYSAGVEETFKNEVFDINGFNYSSQLTDVSFTSTTTYDYTKMDIKQVLEKGKVLLHVIGVIDENYKIPYDKLIESYTKLGFVCEKEK